jgi:hypothetical protein
MDLTGKYVVTWLSPEAVETFLGVRSRPTSLR